MSENNRELTEARREELIGILKSRFEKNTGRNKGIDWTDVEPKLRANPEKLWSLSEMERTAGEPDVIGFEKDAGVYLFVDCCKESPAGRRSLCYDRQALEDRKSFKPGGNAMDLATAMGIEMLSEDQYRDLQKLGPFDTKTSSWVKTPEAIRKLGGALFGDYRYGQVFFYHNGVQSYYGSRGFRGILMV
jgi:hypothetical protein